MKRYMIRRLDEFGRERSSTEQSFEDDNAARASVQKSKLDNSAITEVWLDHVLLARVFQASLPVAADPSNVSERAAATFKYPDELLLSRRPEEPMFDLTAPFAGPVPLVSPFAIANFTKSWEPLLPARFRP